MDVHCDITMGHIIAMGTYHDVTMHIDVAKILHLLSITAPNYDTAVFSKILKID